MFFLFCNLLKITEQQAIACAFFSFFLVEKIDLPIIIMMILLYHT